MAVNVLPLTSIEKLPSTALTEAVTVEPSANVTIASNVEPGGIGLVKSTVPVIAASQT